MSLTLSIRNRELVLRIPPLLLMALLFCSIACFQLVRERAFSEREYQQATIAELKSKNQKLTELVAHKERELEQMATLADARSEELWREVESRDREIHRLWAVVTEQPDGKTESRGTKTRRTLMGSRGSSKARSPLAVKVDFNRLKTHLQESEEEMSTLNEAASEYRRRKMEIYQRELADRTPSITPCDGEMTSGFGNRVHPVYGIGRFHSGCDFTAPHGTPIRATAAGTVVHSDWMGGYGQVIEIDHGDGIKTLYAHCSELLVENGTRVTKGQTIALVGTTGLSSGPHCHYEVRVNDELVDPVLYVPGEDATNTVANQS